MEQITQKPPVQNPLIGRIRPPRIKEVPAGLFFIRGTTTEFSGEGTQTKVWGIENNPDKKAYSYIVIPWEVNVQAWADRFEATINAAVERALYHSSHHEWGEITYGFPCVLIGEAVYDAKKTSIGVPYKQYRAKYELSLVNGDVKPTFRESYVMQEAFVINGCGPYIATTHKIALSEEERSSCKSRMTELTKLSKSDDGFVEMIFGHKMPQRLWETGEHARDPISYVFGELIKGVLIPKIYGIFGM